MQMIKAKTGSSIILCIVLLTLLLSACHTPDQNSKRDSSTQKENSQEETSVDNNTNEESSNRTSSDQVSMWTEESDEIYTVSFPMSESEHAAVYDKEHAEYEKWVRDIKDGIRSDIIVWDPDKQVTSMPGVQMEILDFKHEGDIWKAGQNEKYYLVATRTWDGQKEQEWIHIYDRKRPLTEPILSIDSDRSGGHFLQDMVLVDDILLWCDMLSQDGNLSWKVYQTDILTEHTEEIMRSDYSSKLLYMFPRLTESEGCMISCFVDETNDGHASVRKYDPRIRKWEDLYHINYKVNPYVLMRVKKTDIYSTDYKNEGWIAVRYNLDTGALSHLKLLTKYETEGIEQCIPVGDWILYSSSGFGLNYLMDVYTGDIRYLSSQYSAFEVLGDRYVIYEAESTFRIYDTVEDVNYDTGYTKFGQFSTSDSNELLVIIRDGDERMCVRMFVD